MADINYVVLVGRLTRDAELKYTASGQAISKFSIAVNRRRKSGDQWEDEVNYFDIVVWGRQGEVLSNYLVKGKQVGIEGELKQDRWTQDGQNRSKVEVIASNIQLFGGNPAASGNGQGSGSGNNRSQLSSSNSSNSQFEADGNENPSIPDIDKTLDDDGFTDDIPF